MDAAQFEEHWQQIQAAPMSPMERNRMLAELVLRDPWVRGVCERCAKRQFRLNAQLIGREVDENDLSCNALLALHATVAQAPLERDWNDLDEFAHYWARAIKNKVLDQVRAARRRAKAGRRLRLLQWTRRLSEYADDTRSLVCDAIEELPEPQRSIVQRKVRMPYPTLKVIARDLGIEYGKAKRLFHAALELLRPVCSGEII